ncbi:MAG TPA: OmpW family outer membrane protein [Thermoanaerobaculia bacterium]|nr:OmpW family outer membrane protein [Thermoanaerobaculia bacterium]
MKQLVLLLLLLTVPLQAQTTATLFLSAERNSDGGAFPSDDAPDLETHFDSGSGFGVSIARRFGNVSGELALFRLSSKAGIRQGRTEVFSLGDIDLTPVTAMVRYHFGRGGAFDAHAGAGLAHVTIGDLESADTRAEGLEPISVESETAGVFGGGITYDFSKHIGIAADARYLPLTLRGRPADDDAIEADLNPLVLSAGLRIRF